MKIENRLADLMALKGQVLGHIPEVFVFGWLRYLPVFAHVIEWKNMDMGVIIYIYANNLNADPLRAQNLLYPAGNLAYGLHQSLEVFIRQIPYINLFFRDHQYMSGLYRLDVQKSEGLIVFVNPIAGNLSIDDFAENGVGVSHLSKI